MSMNLGIVDEANSYLYLYSSKLYRYFWIFLAVTTQVISFIFSIINLFI